MGRCMAVIIEYTDMLGVKHLGLQNMPFPDLVKYCVLGVSGLLLLLALGIFLWQIFRCCTRNNATQDTSDDYWESHTVASFLQGPSALNGGPGRRRTLNHPPTLKGGATRELGEPSEDKVSGSLRFSLFYEPLPSRLVVTILQAEGLQRRSQAHRPHPFVRLRLMWEEPENQEQKSSLMNEKGEGEQPALCSALQEWHTRVVRDSCSPLFGEQFSCALLRQHDLPRVTLRMEVKDFDGFSRHMVLGEVRVPLRHLDMSYPLELQEPLQTPQKDPVGQVLLSLRFLPAAQRLEVGVLKIRTLQTDSDSALHARISVRCDQSKLRQQRTTAVHQGQVTVFNQVLMFSLLEFPPQECSIALSVYKTGGNRRHKHLVGQLTVAKQRRAEDLHWTLMMHSVRQPIAMWHQLLT
ncbi:synaptotagmin-2-like [Gadus chalcogrammus]|uniref:synaptotagmin-2-like n=1 Tax=Gadus chalcogrammus TaxID=1042646 RepID=UPI0024C47925|nr:synaptotagmin-2-like [Gadus chalcogrammus]